MRNRGPRIHQLGSTAATVCLLAAATAALADEGPVRVPDGFEVSLYADDSLAHDIFSLTVDSFGRVVVSGMGYTRILVDTDGDGRADKSIQYADGPQTGAQGMYFYGRDLLCSGDGGLIRYRDRNGDDHADGPPDVFLKMNAGGEHHLHAIRKGPDGWWYAIAGNMAGVDASFASLQTSPVKSPYGGTLMRLRPNLAGGEIVADGLRNAYDFDFTTGGELYTFDSDGERDVSLPWYRPTRVFLLTPGSNAGWFSRSWKRPDYFLDMPPVPADFGRGSPTGVVCYRHTQFPEKFRGALFVLDWTYGRVFALPLTAEGSVQATKPIEFMTAVGAHGFAPTDAAVGPDGALYVSVGGRGTRGGVYRIQSTQSEPVVLTEVGRTSSSQQQLEACLDCPQPLSSWARRRWEPLAKEVGEQPFLNAATDRKRSIPQRIRAIEIITEKFHGLDSDLAQQLVADSSPEIRARAAWSIGRTQPRHPTAHSLQAFLEDESPLVVRHGLQALVGADAESFVPLVEPLAAAMGSDDRFVRQAAARLLVKVNEETYHNIAVAANPLGWQAAIPVAQGFAAREGGFSAYSVEIGVRVLEGQHPAARKLEAARLIELGLGDVGPHSGDLPAVFDGYAGPVDLAPHADKIQPFARRIADVYPTGDSRVDHEIARILAMLQISDSTLLNRVLAQITDKTDPVSDIHHMIVAARIPGQRTVDQRNKLAASLLDLQHKIDQRHLRQDTNWDERVLEMYLALAEKDPDLPVALLENEKFGRPGHVLFIAAMPHERVDDIVAAFLKQVQQDENYQWSSELVFLLGASGDPAALKLVRGKFDDFALRGPVLLTLAEAPLEQDRDRFLTGLNSAALDVLGACVKALAILPPRDTPHEIVSLARAMRRLGFEGEEGEFRDEIVELLRLRTGQDFGYAIGHGGEPQQESIDRWTAWVSDRYPDEFARQSGATVDSMEQLKSLLASVEWDRGNAGHGAELFTARRCNQCHSSRQAVGPDLAGAAGRFSREDLFTAIALPNRDVSPRYQTTSVLARDGRVYTGMIVYESVDGIVLRDSNNQTYRLEADNIELRQVLNTSLMPTGLLNELDASDIADLYAYLRILGLQTASAAATPSGGR